MGRMRGERAQDYAARRQFEFFSQVTNVVSIEKRDGLTVVLIEPREVPIACPCSFRPYPHILTDELAIDRHRRGATR
jgi:hypothetical protein